MKNILTIDGKEKEWGPNYLRFGLNLASDTEADTDFSFLADFRMTQLNQLGGEWKTVAQLGEPRGIYSEFYQPFDVQNFFFITPYVEAKERQFIEGKSETWKEQS